MKYLGIDFGSKKIGIAISDEAGHIAFPRLVLQNTPGLVEKVVDLIKDEGVDGIVIGQSVNLDGAKNPIAKEANDFEMDLQRVVNVNVFLEKEWLSSSEAWRASGGFPHPRNAKNNVQRNDVDIDAKSAAIILQRFLDRKDKMN